MTNIITKPKEGKQENLGWYLGALYLPAIIVFALEASSNLSDWEEVTFYMCIMGITCVTLLFLKSDDKFYRNLNSTYLLYAILCGFGMTLLSWGLSDAWLHDPNMLLSINSIGYPFKMPTLSTSTSTVNSFGLVPITSSVTTTFIYEALGGLVMAATVEELFKLVIIAEGQKRWARGLSLSKPWIFLIALSVAEFALWFTLEALGDFNWLTLIIFSATAIAAIALVIFKALPGALIIPGVIGYVGFPVAFWACLHSISAYSNPVMIIPAFCNGIILAAYLLKTHCVLGAIGSHWFYNSAILLLTFLNGTAGVAGLPLLPPIFSASYYSDATFILELFLLFPLAIWAIGFWLIPSLKGKSD